MGLISVAPYLARKVAPTTREPSPPGPMGGGRGRGKPSPKHVKTSEGHREPKGEETKLIIGKNNTFREYVTVNPGTSGGGGITRIGDNCLFMISSHVAHDCNVGNNVIIANNVPLGGHVSIGDNVVIGGNSAVQQFTRIGKLAMIGGMTGVLNDVIPYGLSFGNRNYLQGLNLIGLRRKNIPNKDILSLTAAYKEIFATPKLNENISKLNGEFKNKPLVNDIIEFIVRDKKRPICSPFSK